MEQYKGLTTAQASSSRDLHGSNILTPPKKRPGFMLFLDKFSDPIIRILLIALVLAFGVASYHCFVQGHGPDVFLEPLGIFIAVILATLVGFILEQRANKAFEILNKVNDDAPVKVFRDGYLTELPKKDIVVGDVVIVETGDEIPADGVVLEALSISVNESTLTGEPVARKGLEKDTPEGFEGTYPYYCLMKGTTVSEGRAVMRVTSVGDSTEYGKVYVASLSDSSVKTPLDEQLQRLGRLISIVSYVVAALILVGRTLVYFMDGLHPYPIDWFDFGSYMLDSFMMAVTLIVVSVPEGLPMSVTLSLALSMKRLLASNNLVRKIHACETMGAATVICTDKTGTLTCNQMRVEQAFFPSAPQELVAASMAINSTATLSNGPSARKVIGNPTEGALLLWLSDRGEDIQKIRSAFEIVGQLPFSTERKYMATAVRVGDCVKVYVKGAPEIVMDMCGHFPQGTSCELFADRLRQCQSKAMRTLGFAFAELSASEYSPQKLSSLHGLTFIGIAGIADPVRETVPSAVKSCIDAGIDVKMITGDTSGTALEIGRQAGLVADGDVPEEIHIAGVALSELSDSELSERIASVKIVSRARPLDKERIVRALQARGEVVAVTGDGTNDAPALKAAQVGLSMGDGTSVAKEASDITILDNSFVSIVNAVVWGRSLYKNIQRFILFQLTINLAASLIVLIGAFAGEQSPLTVTQMLWVNLIMDTFAAIALASLPPSRDVLKDRPRRRGDFIISKSMATGIIVTGVLFVVVLYALLLWMKNDDGTLSGYDLSVFFTSFVMLQFWNMFNVKAYMTGHSAFKAMRKAKGFMWMLLVILAGQVMIVNFGGEMFSVCPLSMKDWLLVIGSTSVVLWAGEIVRLLASGGTSGSRDCR